MGRGNEMKWKGKMEYIRKENRDEVRRDNGIKWKGKMGLSGM